MKSLPLAKVYQLIEPGPVVLLATARGGRNNVMTPKVMTPNVMTMSWHMMVEFEPPLIACVVSGADYSFAALKATRECVIAIPARKLLRQVVAVGNSTGAEIDKFAAFGLTPRPAKKVRAPLIAECFANLECRVADTRLVNRYNLFILEVVQAWIDPRQKNPKTLHHRGFGRFAVDGRVITTGSKMR